MTIASPGTWGDRTMPGLEGTFSYNGVVLNDSSSLERYRILRIAGLDGPERRVTESKRPEHIGMSSLEVMEGGRTITFDGVIEAYNRQMLKGMILNLRSAFVDLEEKPLYIDSEFTNRRYIRCRKAQSLSIIESQEDALYRRAFSIELRASDPRIYGDRVKQAKVNFQANNQVVLIRSTDDQKNMGNYYSPIIARIGDVDSLGAWTITNPRFFTDTGTGIYYDGILSGAQGSWYEVNPQLGLVKNQAGVNSLNQKWMANRTYTGVAGMLYAPRDEFGLAGPATNNSGVSGSPKAIMYWRDCWL